MAPKDEDKFAGDAPSKAGNGEAFKQVTEVKCDPFDYNKYELPVIRVKHPDDPKKFYIVNAHEFNEEIHVPFSPEDEKRGAKAVAAKDKAEEEAQRLNALKGIVRGA